jgi:hypothetical protein
MILLGGLLVVFGALLVIAGVFWLAAVRTQDDEEGALSRFFVGHLLYALLHLNETWPALAAGGCGLLMVFGGIELMKMGRS